MTLWPWLWPKHSNSWWSSVLSLVSVAWVAEVKTADTQTHKTVLTTQPMPRLRTSWLICWNSSRLDAHRTWISWSQRSSQRCCICIVTSQRVDADRSQTGHHQRRQGRCALHVKAWCRLQRRGWSHPVCITDWRRTNSSVNFMAH